MEPFAALAPVVGRGGVGGAEVFEEADGAEVEAMAEVLLGVLADDDFGAAAADVEDEEGVLVEGWVGENAAEGPVGFLFAADDVDRELGGLVDGLEEVVGVARVAGGAGGDGADGESAEGTGLVREGGDGLGGAGDGFGLEGVGLVEPLSEAGLLADFQDRFDRVGVEVGDEEFDRVGSDVDDGAALGGGGGQGRGGPWSGISGQWAEVRGQRSVVSGKGAGGRGQGAEEEGESR